jgi:hypothetical protein
MPPRRSTRSTSLTAPSEITLVMLPIAVIQRIFLMLNLPTRLRCFEVCRAWRAVLADTSLGTHLDLTAESDAHRGEYEARWPFPGTQPDALLRCAAARAGGTLASLRVELGHVSQVALLHVLTTNAGALRELHTSYGYKEVGLSLGQAEALLQAAPGLRTFVADLGERYTLEYRAALRALRNEAPFGPLRIRRLDVLFGLGTEAPDVVAFAADRAAHASLEELTLRFARMSAPAPVDAVVNVALARRLRVVKLKGCNLFPASAPALARLLGGNSLTTLWCTGSRDFLDFGATAVLAAALRANNTLTSFSMADCGAFSDAAVATTLLNALTGHASLHAINLKHGGNHIQDAVAVVIGDALGALVAANAPALTLLKVSYCRIGEGGWRPLIEALRVNTHLRELHCGSSDLTQTFAADVLLPAVRANASLRELKYCPRLVDLPDAGHEAMQLVRARQ